MNRLMGLVLTSTLALALAACGDDDTGAEDNTTGDSDSTAESDGTAAAEDYCTLLADSRDALEPQAPDFGEREPTQAEVRALVEDTFAPLMETNDALAAAAPDSVAGAWAAVAEAQRTQLDNVRAWFSDEGWAEYEAATEEERFELMFDYLFGHLEDIEESDINVIVEHAESECDIDLG